MEVSKLALSRRFSVCVLVLGAVSTGCGGASPGEGTTAATDSSGRKIITEDGVAVNEEAFRHWRAGIEMFNKFDAEGWNPDRCNQAVAKFEEAAGEQENFAEAYYMAGVSASKCDAQRARQYYDRSLEANPKFCKARSAIGLIELNGGNQGQAMSTFQRAIRDDARCLEAYVNLAILQKERGGPMLDEARINLRRALAIESNYLPAFNELALLFLASGTAQNLDLAEVVARQAQLLDRDYAPIYNTWGLIKMRKNDIIEALRMFERARALDNNMFEAHMNFGQITLSFRGYEDAKTSFARAVELQPNSYAAHIGLGAALRGLGQYDGAEAQYQKAIQLDAARPEAYFNLGLIYQDYRSGQVVDLRKAKSYYEQFLAKAQGKGQYAETIEAVSRRCRQQQGRKRRRRRADCQPGRMQNIETAVDALEEMSRLQQKAGG